MLLSYQSLFQCSQCTVKFKHKGDVMEVAIGIFLFIIGTIFGSFYNVVGYRIPKGESIVYPPSHCTNCNHKLTFFELIPVLSYIFQKGKCKHCHQKISLFYPIFETLTGVLFVLSYISYGLTPELIIALTFVSLMIIIALLVMLSRIYLGVHFFSDIIGGITASILLLSIVYYYYTFKYKVPYFYKK